MVVAAVGDSANTGHSVITEGSIGAVLGVGTKQSFALVSFIVA